MVSGCRPAGCPGGTVSVTVSSPRASREQWQHVGAHVTFSTGSPMRFALMPSMTSPVLTTSTTTAAVSPGSTATTRLRVEARTSEVAVRCWTGTPAT